MPDVRRETCHLPPASHLLPADCSLKRAGADLLPGRRLPIKRFACLTLLILSSIPCRLVAQDFKLGASLRGFAFYSVEDSPFQPRRDTEFLSFRVVPEFSLNQNVKFEAHLVADLVSPPFSSSTTLATGGTRTLMNLDWNLVDRTDLTATAGFDRLNVQVHTDEFQLIVGRQAVTWGVNYFWPALDLFAPFAPSRIDRDYKAGVDAARLIVPVGSYSEVQVIGAVLGPSTSDDLAAGALVRWNLSTVDFGFMGGSFHQDKVAGSFVTANVKGTGLRAEISWTQSGDPRDQQLNRGVFWRGSAGIDRQLTPTTTLIFETAWSQYGASDPRGYLLLLGSDRVARGEVNALGRYHSGLSVTWQVHPLWNFNNTALLGWDDRSALWVPSLVWSTGNNSELLFGSQVSFGHEITPTGVPRSEYGSYPSTLFASFKVYM